MHLPDAMTKLHTLYVGMPQPLFTEALLLCARGNVSVEHPGTTTVRYGKEGGPDIATVEGGACDCDPLADTREVCAHVLAASLYEFLHEEHSPGALTTSMAPYALRQPLALPLRSIHAIITDLSRPFPECVATKTLKGNTISYLHWQTVARILDTYAPGWEGTVARVDQVGSKVAITYRLSIPTQEGLLHREATGQEDEAVDSYGDSTSNAEAMAFKRAAAKFGVGTWLYDKDSSAPAWRKQVQEEQLAGWKTLGVRVDAARMDREQVGAWLCAVTGVARKMDVPLSALKAFLASLTKN